MTSSTFYADAAAGHSDASATFHAFTKKVKSRESSVALSSPAAAGSARTAFHTRPQTLAWVQVRCRRQHITSDGKQAGGSFHMEPSRSWWSITREARLAVGERAAALRVGRLGR